MGSTTLNCALLVFIWLTISGGEARRAEYNGTVDWWQKTVIYQVYPRSFQDSDNDGVGDIKGITSRLDYIKDLGVETVWISPIYKSPMKDFGYDVSDYRAIDPTFGTMADFDELVTEIKSRGMKLMLDYVPNHSSNEHDWFNKSIAREGQYSDYYIWRDGTGPNGTGPPNNWISVFGGSAWEFVPQRNQSYLHQFLIEQPDLNFRNPKVHEEVLDNMRFWLDKGVDGFRIDAPIFSYENINLPDEPRSWDNTSTPFDYSYLNHVYTTCQPETLELVSEWRDLMNSYKSKDNKHRALILEFLLFFVLW